MRIMCYIAPEIVLHICYNKPVKVPIVYYGKVLHAGVVLRQTQHSALPQLYRPLNHALVPYSS